MGFGNEPGTTEYDMLREPPNTHGLIFRGVSFRAMKWVAGADVILALTADDGSVMDERSREVALHQARCRSGETHRMLFVNLDSREAYRFMTGSEPVKVKPALDA
jgi:hypothetical protein